jgi:hypothetical protein
MRDGSIPTRLPAPRTVPRTLPDRATRIMAVNGVMLAALLVVTASLLCATFGVHSAWTFRAAAAR